MTLTIRDKIKDLDDRRIALRKEVTAAIVELLKENNLTELNLCKEEDHQVYMTWFDDNCNGYDSRVNIVRLTEEDFELELDGGESNESTHTVSRQDGDFACNNIDWLVGILDNMNFTLSLPESKGVATIEGQTIAWSYQERGLCKLPEREYEFIAETLKDGKTNGTLYYNDNDVEFEGNWHIVPELSVKEKMENLRKEDKRLGLNMCEVLSSIIRENGGRITYSLPESADDDDYPVSLHLRGEVWNYNFYLTAVYLNDEGQIMADGFEILDGVRHDSSEVIDSEHYSQILDFISETLNL